MLLAWIVFAPFLGGLITWLIGRRNENARDVFAIAFTFCELVLCLFLNSKTADLKLPGILAMDLTLTTDGFRHIYAVITALMWAGTTAFGREYFLEEREHLNRYWFFFIFTLGATEGVMLSADLMTTFVFFEILSFTSFTWVIHEETEGAVRAGYTYLFIAVIGGLILFMGLALLQHTLGTLSFTQLRSAAAASEQKGVILAGSICVLLGFGAKAGMFPLHVWLPKAHPVAPSPASALLSGVLTKVGIYGILMTALHILPASRPFGLLILILAMITMFLGAVLALFSVNLKRTLACSSMSQIGFILTGVAMMILLTEAGEEEGIVLATSGLMLHMVNHSLIKLTLFMAAGVVVMNLHHLDLDTIRGWGCNKLFLKIAFALGALGISGVPMFNGYISKTLLHEGIVEGIHACGGLHGLLSVVEWVFLISGGITFCYMLKIFICVFIEKNADPGLQAQYDSNSHCMNRLSTGVIFGSSLLMVVLGQPAVMMRLAAYMSGYEEILHFQAFTWVNLKGGLISLGIGACLYIVVVRRILIRRQSYVNLWPQKLDLEERVYRPVLTRILPFLFGNLAAVFGENKVFKPLCKVGLAGFGQIAKTFGENRILKPVCKAGVWMLGFIGRILETSTDATVAFLRRTVMRERKVRGVQDHPGLFRTLLQEARGALTPLTSNFTYAMMMTCIGILIVLCSLIAAVL